MLDWQAILDGFRLQPIKSRAIENDFSRIDTERCNWCFYQLGLRPNIPIVDFYYLQYLLRLLRDEQIGSLIIYPSVDLSFPSQDIADFHMLQKRVLAIFAEQKDKVQLIDPTTQKHNLSSVALLSKDFLSSIRYIAGDDFRSTCRHILNDRRWTWRDCNRYHPGELQLVSIYVHTVRGYIMWHFLQEELKEQNKEILGPIRVGFLIWETEMAKLAVFDRLSAKFPKFTLSPILGRTIYLGGGKPLPVFEPDKTVDLFSDMSRTLDLLCNQDKRHNAILYSLLQAAMDANYPTTKAVKAHELQDFAKRLTIRHSWPADRAHELRGDVLAVARLIEKFQDRFSS